MDLFSDVDKQVNVASDAAANQNTIKTDDKDVDGFHQNICRG